MNTWHPCYPRGARTTCFTVDRVCFQSTLRSSRQPWTSGPLLFHPSTPHNPQTCLISVALNVLDVCVCLGQSHLGVRTRSPSVSVWLQTEAAAFNFDTAVPNKTSLYCVAITHCVDVFVLECVYIMWYLCLSSETLFSFLHLSFYAFFNVCFRSLSETNSCVNQ